MGDPHERGAAGEGSEAAGLPAGLLDALDGVALFELSADGRVRRWTAPAQRLLLYEAGDVVGRSFACLHTNDAITGGVPAQWLDEARRHGRVEANGWLRRRDGSMLHAACVLVAEAPGVFGPGGFAVACRDRTTQCAAEEQARLGEERLRVLAASVQGQVACELSLSGEIRNWNADAEALTGYPASEAVGQPFLAFCHRDDAEADRRALEEARATGHWSGEMRLPHPDGRVLRCASRIALVRDAAGCPAGLVWTARDIGRERRLEAFEDETRRVRSFLAILAHELRNPLAPIGNAVDVIRLCDPADPRIRHCTEIIGRQLRLLSRLVGDLLDFGRIAAGKLGVERVPAQYQEIVAAGVETMQPSLEAAGLHLAVSVPPQPLWIDGDPARLRQVLCNLLGNAIRYTPRGGTVTLRVTEDAGRVVTTLADTGRGISPAALERIFDLFAQETRPQAEGEESGSGGNRGGAGLGIGLALARAVVEAHGGSIQADSPGPGRGSTFTVTLPLAQPARLVAEQAADARDPGASEATRIRRVLVVDDNADSADSKAELLGVLGHEGLAAYSGALALSLVESFQPDCILLDLEMPEHSGYDVLDALCARAGGKAGIQVFALTGRGTAEDRLRTRAAGFDGHLVKPVSLAALSAVLQG